MQVRIIRTSIGAIYKSQLKSAQVRPKLAFEFRGAEFLRVYAPPVHRLHQYG